MKTVSSDLKRAFSSKGFWVGLLFVVIVLAFASLEAIVNGTANGIALPNGFHAQLLLDALSSDEMTLALPILCILPYTTAYVDDIKSGYIKLYLPRTSIGSYIKGKLIACGLSGGLVLFAGILIAYGLSVLVFTPMELAPKIGTTATNLFGEVISAAATLSLSGAFWSLTGLALAALTLSRYMAYASPFVLYYVLIILHERYFKDFTVLYPKEWLVPSTVEALGNYGPTILLLELGFIACCVFALAARKRLENG